MIRPATWTTNHFSGIGLHPMLVKHRDAQLRDMKHRSGRGSRLRPLRTIDVILGFVLTVPSLMELSAILPENLAGFGL